MVSKAMRVAALAAVFALPLLMASGSGAVSIGTGATATVTQSGLLNYAGPSCPGAGWNCTTATNVVQFAAPGGQNRFECQPAATGTNPTTNTCVVDQHGDTNHARCFISDTTEPSTETCDISQEGDRNYSDVHMTTRQGAGPGQTATQIASVDQTATEHNQSQVIQDVGQQTSAGSSQHQEAYQLADVRQTASGSDNFSHVHQSQEQGESGNATAQNQNTDPQPLCETKNANQCALVLQQNGGGQNASHLHQMIGENQSTKAGSATQLQGDLPTGQEGAIHQVNPDGVGQNEDLANQDQRQRASGPGGTTQAQHTGDGKCCGPSQIGGRNNHEFIHQSSTQSASEDSAEQDALLIGEVHQGSDPSNACSIDQHARINDASSHESVSGTDAECLTLFLATTCYSGESVANCTTTQNPCDVPPFCDFSVGSTLPLLGLPTSPTFGRDIAMPDYTSEPSGYVDPGGWW